MSKITDAHQHFWKKELFAGKLPPELAPLLANFGPEDLKPQMELQGVQQTVLVQTHSALKNNEEFLAIADAHDWVGAVVGWVDLTDPGVGETLDRLSTRSSRACATSGRTSGTHPGSCVRTFCGDWARWPGTACATTCWPSRPTGPTSSGSPRPFPNCRWSSTISPSPTSKPAV